jgi:endonuclease YncB( thermonuclease family)
MKPLLSNPEREREKILALAAKTRFTELVNKHPDRIVKMDCSDFDKYGRLLVTLWNGVDEKSINEIMLEEGHGKKYDGGKKESWV